MTKRRVGGKKTNKRKKSQIKEKMTGSVKHSIRRRKEQA
jgi:hypothetical protein